MPRFVMSDARAFTDYNPNCELNKRLQEKYQLKNGHEYRYFLQKNAEQIMKQSSECVGKSNEDKVCPICQISL